MLQLPTGTLTFLYTDVENSTLRWEQYPGAMKAAIERHDAILQDAIDAAKGIVFRRMGDGFCACFVLAPQALDAVLAAQRALHMEKWDPRIAPIKVRMALHTGPGEVRDGDYVGPHLNRIARLLAVGYGGQVLLTGATYPLVFDTLPEGVGLRDLGDHKLKDHFRDGVFFVPLAALTDPALVPVAIARTLGLMGDGNRPIIESLKAYLGQKELLLLLDNFEQVSSAGQVVSELLSDASQLK